MIDDKKDVLTGANNKRINNSDLRNNQMNFPLADVRSVTENANLTFPSEEDVVHAKKWIDNGSQL